MKLQSISDEVVFREARAIPRAPLANWWRGLCAGWVRIVRMGRSAPRRLRLCESLPLGERRFIAVVEFERSRFLLGGTSGSLVLLARLGDASGDESRVASPAAGFRGEDSDDVGFFAADFDRPDLGRGGK